MGPFPGTRDLNFFPSDFSVCGVKILRQSVKQNMTEPFESIE